MFCQNCGAQNPDSNQFCAGCGQTLTGRGAQPNQMPPPQQQYGGRLDKGNPSQPHYGGQHNQPYPPPPPYGGQNQGYPPPPPGGVTQQEKTMSILAYFIFFIPLLVTPNSQFARYHANQGLILLLSNIAVGIVQSILSAILLWGLWGILSIVFSLAYIAILVFGIMGIVNAVNQKMEPMPVIGSLFTLIK